MTQATFHSPEDLRDSVESLQRVHGRDRPLVYWMFLLVAGAAAISLPLVKVDLSVGGQGQVRPAIERISVFPAVDGYIKQIHVSDNQAVKKGELLLEIDSPVVDARTIQNARQAEENHKALRDLAALLKTVTVAEVRSRLGLAADDIGVAVGPATPTGSLPEQLRTPNYLRQYALFSSQLQKTLVQRSKLVEDGARSRSLHQRGLVSDQEFAQQQYAQASAEREIDFVIEQTLSQWQADKIERELKQIDLESEARQLAMQKELYALRAPVDGTALGFAGLHTDVFVPVGQRLGEISPSDRLQAEVYLSPRDIGFVRAGQRVAVQVDAFPYTEWGTVKGRVRTVSQDFIQVGNQPAFKAVIDLATTRLRSAAGVVVELRRGMTVNARFIVKQRSLFSVLFETLSAALDPTAKAASG